MEAGGPALWPRKTYGVQDSCCEKQQISLGLVIGLVSASRRAQNARASDAGQRMT